MDPFYHTIETTSFAEFKDRGSRFIGYVFPAQTTEAVKNILKEVKLEHPKADHFCFAYRLGFDKNNFRVSDAGEPSGSAGRPILGQIDSRHITNVLVVVVRYFGGTLLGVPGLINAYKTAASFALQTNPVVQKEIMVSFQLEFDYTCTNEVHRILKQSRALIGEKEAKLFCLVKVTIPKTEVTSCLSALGRLHGVTVEKF